MLRILLVLFITLGCASNERTKYQAYSKKKGGYQEKNLEDNLRSVFFKANSSTKKKLAYTFAEFRAIESCSEAHYKLAHFLDANDKSESKTIRRSSAGGYPGYGYGFYPSYYYGQPPFYNHYSGFNYGFGISTMSGSTWDETFHYPEIEILFECVNEVFEPQIGFREVSSEELKNLVKDLRGGLQIEKMMKDSINQSTFRNGDILLRASGERIQKVFQLLSKLSNSKSHYVTVDILRDGILMTGLVLKGINVTDSLLMQQNKIIKSACKNKDVKKRKLCK